MRDRLLRNLWRNRTKLFIQYMVLVCDYVRFFDRHVLWFWQRRTRGWDDREIWGLNSTLCRFMVPRLRLLKVRKKGVPCCCFQDDDWDYERYEYKAGAEERAEARWQAIMDEMIEGFEMALEREPQQGEPWGVWSAAQKIKVQRAFDLLAQYHASLWD